MNVVYIGNFRPKHSTENEIAKALSNLGHTVGTLQEDALTEFKSTMGAIEGFEPDLLLYTRTWGLPDWGTDMLTECGLAGIPTASYHLDLYLGLNRDPDVHMNNPFWATDYVFTPDGAPESQAEFERRGINHVYMKPAVSKLECQGIVSSETFASPVAFFGSYTQYHHNEWPYRRELVSWLMETYKGKFRLWGNDTQQVRGMELRQAVGASQIIVGDSLCLGFNHPYYWSDRIYELVGRGGFVIHPYIEGLDEEFVDGLHCVFYNYGDFEGLKAAIDHYMYQSELRGLIRSNGQKMVREHCTYNNRLQQALEIMGLSDGDS